MVVLLGMAVLVQIASGAPEPNGVFPNDPYFPRQWDLHNTGQNGAKPGVDIHVTKAWEITTGDPNIIVAIIGDGLDLEHPDLVRNLVPGTDFFDNDDRPEPSYGALSAEYDTIDAGVIAAEGNNAIGVAGVTWHCKIMEVRIYSRLADSSIDGVSASTEAGAWRWAATHGADVIHYNHNSAAPAAPAVRAALIDISKAGSIGRNGKGCVLVTRARAPFIGPGIVYYAAHPEMISVDAVDAWDRLPFPQEPRCRVDLVAPVANYDLSSPVVSWSTDIHGPYGWNDGDYGENWGLPAAAPLVSGVAALILSVEPNLTSEEVRHYLCRSAHDLGAPGWDEEYGWGRVDARAALDMVLAKRADLNDDWTVDEEDLAVLTAALETEDLSADIAPATQRDGRVDAKDRELLVQYLGTRIPEVPEAGLIAHWTLDETQGQVAHGSAVSYEAMTPHATVHGEPTWQPEAGRKAGALQFDGADDYVEMPFVLDPAAGSFSVFAWVQGGAPGQVILSQDQGANWLLAASPNGALTTHLSSGRAGPLSSSAVVMDGGWHRVGLVRDGTERLLYVDGIEVARDTVPTLAGSTGGLHLGTGKGLEPDTFWSGLIDDVRIYDRAVKP